MAAQGQGGCRDRRDTRHIQHCGASRVLALIPANTLEAPLDFQSVAEHSVGTPRTRRMGWRRRATCATLALPCGDHRKTAEQAPMGVAHRRPK